MYYNIGILVYMKLPQILRKYRYLALKLYTILCYTRLQERYYIAAINMYIPAGCSIHVSATYTADLRFT